MYTNYNGGTFLLQIATKASTPQEVHAYKEQIRHNIRVLTASFQGMIRTATTKVNAIHPHLEKVEILVPYDQTEAAKLESFLQTVSFHRVMGLVSTDFSKRNLWNLPLNNEAWHKSLNIKKVSVIGVLDSADAELTRLLRHFEENQLNPAETTASAHSVYGVHFETMKALVYNVIGVELIAYLIGPLSLGPTLPPHQDQIIANIMANYQNGMGRTIDDVFVNQAELFRDRSGMPRVDRFLRAGIIITTDHTRGLLIMSASLTVPLRATLLSWLEKADAEALKATDRARDNFIRRPRTEIERQSILEALKSRYTKYGSDIQRVKIVYQLRIIAVSASFIFSLMWSREPSRSIVKSFKCVNFRCQFTFKTS